MEAPAHQKCEDSGGNTLLGTIQLASATCPPTQPHTGPSATTLGGDDSGLIGDTTVFERYFSLPAALVRHKSAPLLRERERFLAHLEATGTRRSAIRIAATYLLQVLNILGLRRLRDVTLEEIDRAADHWNTVRNQDKQYPAGQFGVRCFAQTARRFLRFEGNLQCPRLPQPFSKYLEEFVEAMSAERGLSEATIRGRRYRAADFLKWYARRHRGLRGIRLMDIDAYTSRKPLEGRNPVTRHSESSCLRAFFRHAESRGGAKRGP